MSTTSEKTNHTLALFLKLTPYRLKPALPFLLLLILIIGFALFSHSKAFAKSKSFAPEMVEIEAGNYTMTGSINQTELSNRKVNLKKFEIGKYEVTQGQWRAVMGVNPSHFKDCGKNCPVEQVTWHGVQNFIKKLNIMTGKNYRLPSEAEWEYVARAGCSTMFNFAGKCSKNVQPSQANFFEESTKPVGSYSPNSMNVYDMHGNVWEWVQDCYEETYDKGQPTDGTAYKATDDKCVLRVLRGGSWDAYPYFSRPADRFWGEPAANSIYFGFRLARTLD